LEEAVVEEQGVLMAIQVAQAVVEVYVQIVQTVVVQEHQAKVMLVEIKPRIGLRQAAAAVLVRLVRLRLVPQGLEVVELESQIQ
jgi:hypothetical protein